MLVLNPLRLGWKGETQINVETKIWIPRVNVNFIYFFCFCFTLISGQGAFFCIYLVTVTWENNTSSCFGFSMTDTHPFYRGSNCPLKNSDGINSKAKARFSGNHSWHRWCHFSEAIALFFIHLLPNYKKRDIPPLTVQEMCWSCLPAVSWPKYFNSILFSNTMYVCVGSKYGPTVYVASTPFHLTCINSTAK